MVDIPGHERVRSKYFDQFKSSARLASASKVILGFQSLVLVDNPTRYIPDYHELE